MISRAGLRLRAARARRADARPHRRLQVLPRERAAGDRRRDGHRAGLRLPGRAHLARALARPHASSRCRSASASAGSASPRCPPASRSRRRGGFRPCATGRGAGGLRCRRTAQLPMQYRVKSDQLALVQGWPHTRATLRRWNAAPGGSSPRGRSARCASRRCCWPPTWFVADNAVADPTAHSYPGLTRPATTEDFLFVLRRNVTVLALHALACVAGFMAGWVRPGRADEPRAEARGAARDHLRDRRHAVLPAHAGERARPRRRRPGLDARASSPIRCCCACSRTRCRSCSPSSCRSPPGRSPAAAAHGMSCWRQQSPRRRSPYRWCCSQPPSRPGFTARYTFYSDRAFRRTVFHGRHHERFRYQLPG